MKYSVIGLIVLGLVAAFAAALLLAMINGTRPGANREVKQVSILVAKAAMPSVSVVEDGAFDTKTVPVNEAPAGYLSNPVQVIGRTLVRPVVAGQPLTADLFAADSRGVQLVSALAEGKRAVTVELSHAAGLEGLLYPGSVVDVMATFKVRPTGSGQEEVAVSTMLIQGVEVLAIDAETGGSARASDDDAETKAAVAAASRRKTRRVTLLVDIDQAKALQLATSKGTISLAMRNPQDRTIGDLDPTLLSGGRMAKLAEYLDNSTSASGAGEPVKAAVREPVEPAQVEPVAATVPTPAPALTPAPAPTRLAVEDEGPQRWDVTILRGSSVEVRELTRQPETADR